VHVWPPNMHMAFPTVCKNCFFWCIQKWQTRGIPMCSVLSHTQYCRQCYVHVCAPNMHVAAVEHCKSECAPDSSKSGKGHAWPCACCGRERSCAGSVSLGFGWALNIWSRANGRSARGRAVGRVVGWTPLVCSLIFSVGRSVGRSRSVSVGQSVLVGWSVRGVHRAVGRTWKEPS
jgi:hypothetical protein